MKKVIFAIFMLVVMIGLTATSWAKNPVSDLSKTLKARGWKVHEDYLPQQSAWMIQAVTEDGDIAEGQAIGLIPVSVTLPGYKITGAKLTYFVRGSLLSLDSVWVVLRDPNQAPSRISVWYTPSDTEPSFKGVATPIKIKGATCQRLYKDQTWQLAITLDNHDVVEMNMDGVPKDPTPAIKVAKAIRLPQ